MGALAAVLWLLAAAGGLIWWTAGDGGLLGREMLRYAAPEKTGLPEAEYAGVGRMTADYLTGRTDRFQYIFSDAEGKTYQCFQEHEAAHMADCRKLIALSGRVCLGALGGLAVCLLIAMAPGRSFARENRRAFGQGMLRGMAAMGILAAALLTWAIVDFDGFFTAFHRIAFDNEGWLLNPRTDLLIRLMPTAFFIGLGLRGLGFWGIAAVVAIATMIWMKAGESVRIR